MIIILSRAMRYAFEGALRCCSGVPASRGGRGKWQSLVMSFAALRVGGLGASSPFLICVVGCLAVGWYVTDRLISVCVHSVEPNMLMRPLPSIGTSGVITGKNSLWVGCLFD